MKNNIRKGSNISAVVDYFRNTSCSLIIYLRYYYEWLFNRMMVA